MKSFLTPFGHTGLRIVIKAAFVLEKIYYFRLLYNFFATTTIEQSVNDEKK